MSCFVPNCRNYYKRFLLDDSSNISFHRFPKNESMFRKWLEAIGRNDPNISWSKSMLICSEHFKPEQLFKYSLKTHLAASAVPERIYPKTKNSFAMKDLITSTSSICETDASAQYLSNESSKNERFVNCNSREILVDNISSNISQSRIQTNGNKLEKNILTKKRHDTWMQAIGRNPFAEHLSEKNVICSKHYSPEDICREGKKIRLRPNAVPKLYLRKSDYKVQHGSSRVLKEMPLNINTTSEDSPQGIAGSMGDIEVNFVDDKKITPGLTISCIEESSQICITCNEEFTGEPHLVNSSLNNSRTTCKDMIIQLVPQKENKIKDVDVICDRCYKILTTCVQFIQRCLQAESKLEDVSDVVQVEAITEDEMEFEEDVRVKFEEITESSSNNKTDGDDEVNNTDHNYVSKPKPRILNPLPRELEDADRVISVKRPNDRVLGSMIASLNTAGIRVFNCYSRSKSPLSMKRVILLGTAIPPKLIKCEECGKIIRNQRMALKHQQTHKRVRERKDRMRKIAMQRKEERERMRNEARLEAKTRIRCPTCQADCKSKEELKEHIASHPLLVCEVCGKGFAERYRLKIHMRTHNQTKSCVCHICGRCYGSLSLLKQHFSRHEEGRFLCNKCPKIFRHSLALKNHLKRHDSTSWQECKECGKKCKTKAALRSHYRLFHLKNGNFKCEICGEGFVRGDYLKRHIKRHMKSEYEVETRPSHDSGPFMCKICDKVFPKLLGLKHHLYTHASLKPYRCKYCGLTFNRMPNKYRHEKRHENDSTFNNKCPVCWRLCQNEEELKEHISHHSTPYQCEYCELSFARRYLLTHHISENHAIPNEEALYYDSILQESLEVKYPRAEFLFENDVVET